MTEIEILVPVSVQTCGEFPSWHWRFPSVSIDSFDTPQVETIYELRKIRVPEDATKYLMQGARGTYVCWDGRFPPPPFEKNKKKGPGTTMEKSGAPAPTPFQEVDDWYPLRTTPDEWEETGRFLQPLTNQQWLKVGTGFPVEAYGGGLSVGLWFMEPRWKRIESISGAMETDTRFDGSAGLLTLTLLSGAGDFLLRYSEIEGAQTIRFSGIDPLGRPFDEFVDRSIDVRYAAVEWTHPWLAALLYEATDWHVRMDLRTPLGVSLAQAQVAETTSAAAGFKAAALETIQLAGLLALALKIEMRYRSEWSLAAEFVAGTGVGADELLIGAFFSASLGIEGRW
jgi:hypothetical protein